MRLDPPLAPFRSTRSGRLARSNTGPLEERPSAALRLPRVLMLTYVVRFRPCSSIRTRRIVPRTIGRELVVAIWHAPPRSAPPSPQAVHAEARTTAVPLRLIFSETAPNDIAAGARVSEAILWRVSFDDRGR